MVHPNPDPNSGDPNPGLDQNPVMNNGQLAIPIKFIRKYQVHSTPSFKIPRGNISKAVFLETVLAILRKIPKEKCCRFTAKILNDLLATRQLSDAQDILRIYDEDKEIGNEVHQFFEEIYATYPKLKDTLIMFDDKDTVSFHRPITVKEKYQAHLRHLRNLRKKHHLRVELQNHDDYIKRLEDKLEALTNQVNAQDNYIQQLEDEWKVVTEQRIDAENRISDMEGELTMSEKTKVEFESKIMKLEATKASLNQKRSLLRNQILYMKEKLGISEQKTSELKSKISKLEGTKVSLHKKRSTLKNRIMDTEAKLSSYDKMQLTSKAKLQEFEERRSSLGQDRSSIKEQISDMKGKLNISRKVKSDLLHKISEADKKAASLSSESSIWQNKIAVMEGKLGTLLRSQPALYLKSTQYEGMERSLKTKSNTLQANIFKIKRRIQEQELDIEHAKRSFRARISALEKEVEQNNFDVEEAKILVEEIMERDRYLRCPELIKQFPYTIGWVRVSLGRLEEVLNQSKEELSVAEREAQCVTEQLDTNLSESKAVMNLCQKQDAEIDSTKLQIAAAKDEKESVTSQLRNLGQVQAKLKDAYEEACDEVNRFDKDLVDLENKFEDVSHQITHLDYDLANTKSEYENAIEKTSNLKQDLANSKAFYQNICDEIGNINHALTNYQMEHEEVSDANRNLNEELVHVKVELGNVSDAIDDLDRDLANTTADYENVSDRISILSQDLVNVTADFETATDVSSSLHQVLADAKADFEKGFDEIDALRTVLDETVSNIHDSFDEAQRDDDTFEEHQRDIAKAGLEKLLSENLSPTSTKSSESVSSISAENDVQVESLAKRERLRKERESNVTETLNVNGANTRNIMLHPSDDGHVTNAKGTVVHIKNRAQDKSHSGNEDAYMPNSIDKIQALTSGLDDRCNDACVKNKWNTINCHRNTKQTGLFLYRDGNVRTSLSNFCRELHAYLAQKGHVQSQRILKTVKFSMSLTVMMALLLETMKAFKTQDRHIIVLVSSMNLGTDFISNVSLVLEAELCISNRGTTIHSLAIRIQRFRTQVENAGLKARDTTHIGSTKQAVFYFQFRQDYLREVERPSTPLLSNLDSGMFTLQRAMSNNDVIWNYELQSIKHDSKISHVEEVKIAYEILNHQWTTRHRALTVDSQSHQDVEYDESFMNEVFKVVSIDANSTYAVMPEEMSASKHASLNVFFVNYGRQIVTLKTADIHLRKHSASSTILKHNASNAILSDKVVFLYTGNHRTKVVGTTGIRHGQNAQVQNIIMPFNCETYAFSCQFQDKDLIQGDSIRLGFSNGDHRGTHCTGGSMDFDTIVALSARDDKHYGHSVDETTLLLRANAASNACALRFFKHLGMICGYLRMDVTRAEGYQHGMHCTGGYPDSNIVCSTFLHKNTIFTTSEILTWIENAVDEKTPLLDDRAVLDLQAVCHYKKLGMHWEYLGSDVNDSTQQNNLCNATGDGFQLLTPKDIEGANNHMSAIPIIQTYMVYVLVEHSDVIRMATAAPENNFNIGVCLVQKYQEEDTIFLFEQLKTKEGDGVYVPGAKIHAIGAGKILFSTASADDLNCSSTLTYDGAQIGLCVVGFTQMPHIASNTISGETNGALMCHVKCLNSRNDSAETNGAKLKFHIDREIEGIIISVTNFIPMENEIIQCVKSGKPIAIRCTGTSDFSRNEDAGKAGIKIIKSVKYEQYRSAEDVYLAITVSRFGKAAREDTSHCEHKFYTGGYQNMNYHETFVELITLIDMNIEDIAIGKCKDEVEFPTTSLIREAGEGNILDAKSDNTTKVIFKFRKLRGKRKCHEIPLTTDGIMIDCQYLYMESPRQKALLDQRYRICKVEIVEKSVIRVTSIIEIRIANRTEPSKAENDSLNETDCVTCSGEIANGRFFETVVTTKYGQFTTFESRASTAIKSVTHTNVKAIVAYSTPGNNTDGPFENTNMGDRISAYKSKQGNIKYTECTFRMNNNGINGMKCDDDGNNYPNDSVVCFKQQVLRTNTMDTKCDKFIYTAALFGKPSNCGKLEYVYGDIEKWRAILQTDITARIRCDIQQQAQGNKTVMKFEGKGETSNEMMDKGGLGKAISDRCPHDTTILCIEDASERTYYKAFENVKPDECKSFQKSPYQAGDKETKPVQEHEQYRKKVIITKLTVVMKAVHMVLQSLCIQIEYSQSVNTQQCTLDTLLSTGGYDTENSVVHQTQSITGLDGSSRVGITSH